MDLVSARGAASVGPLVVLVDSNETRPAFIAYKGLIIGRWSLQTGLIRPENLVSHILRGLRVFLGVFPLRRSECDG